MLEAEVVKDHQVAIVCYKPVGIEYGGINPALGFLGANSRRALSLLHGADKDTCSL